MASDIRRVVAYLALPLFLAGEAGYVEADFVLVPLAEALAEVAPMLFSLKKKNG